VWGKEGGELNPHSTSFRKARIFMLKHDLSYP
jgi:hypothetical protein